MSITAAALRELHRIHRQLSDLRERLDRGPKQVKARQAHVAKVQEELAQIQEKLQRTRMAADKKQLDLKSNENKILDLRVKLNGCNSNKEYQALLDQIAAAEMANSVLSDEILEALELIDTMDQKIREAKERVATTGQELDALKSKVEAAADGIRTDIARLEKELRAAEDSLPAEFRADYQRVVNARGDDALAPVESGYCGGCYQNITPNMQNELVLSRAVFCKSCGRLLYLSQDPSTKQHA
ncbi:MAG: phospholipase [Pirellulales bacterium]